MQQFDIWINPLRPPIRINLSEGSYFDLPDITISVTNSEEGRPEQILYHSQAVGLAVKVSIRWFSESCCDWLTEIENISLKPTPIIDDISTINASFGIRTGSDLSIHTLRGSNCASTDFLPYSVPLPELSRMKFAPEGGRSSNTSMPFFNVVGEDKSIVVAVGWTGQWSAFFERDSSGSLKVACGLERFRAYLNPGEKIRQPRILIAQVVSSDPADGWNAIRRVVFKHYAPDSAATPISYTTAFTIWDEILSQKQYDGDAPIFEAEDTKKAAVYANETNQLKCIDAAAEVGCDAYWLDAYWYKEGFPNGVGNWKPRQDGFPNGLKPLADGCHEKSIKFILWFEPERAIDGTELATLHPEYLLDNPNTPGQYLFNLADAEAVSFLSDYISEKITNWNLDVYRQDFNVDPLIGWRSADDADREGITESKYIAGLYTFWSNLLERHPGLMIDNCASGGRRIDIETLSLSVPLWRSDTPDMPIWLKSAMSLMPLADQVQCSGLSLISPYHSGGVWSVDPYTWRSAMGSGPQIYFNLTKARNEYANIRKAIAETRSLQKYIGADFYNLVEVTTSLYDWCAWQFHLEDADEGYALFFRRSLSKQQELPANLRGIKEGCGYEYSIAYDFDQPEIERIPGAELRQMLINIPDRPGSALLRYARRIY